MYLVDYNKLEFGDIILTGNKSVVGTAVKIFTLSKFSHAMLWIGGTLIHSDGGGVYSKNPQRILFKNKSNVKVLRIKIQLTESQKKLIEEKARSLVGTVYSTLEAALVVVPLKLPMSERQFCSRLVAQCYHSAGINLVKNIDFCSPAQFDNPELFDDIVDAVRLAKQEDIDFAQSRNVNLETQVDTIQMLTELRKKYGKNIQTINDVFNLVLKKPQFDADVTKIALDSGYFDHAEVDMEVNQWRYNEHDFIAHANMHNISIEIQAREIHDIGNSVISVYKNELNRYLEAFKNNKLAFFYHHTILYKRLINTDNIRKDMAINIIKNHSK